MTELQQAARQALALMDLTSLNDDDSDATIEALCQRAKTPAGTRKSMEEVSPDALLRPANKAVVERLPRPVDLGRVDPAATGLQDMDDARDDPSVIDPRLAARVGR